MKIMFLLADTALGRTEELVNKNDIEERVNFKEKEM